MRKRPASRWAVGSPLSAGLVEHYGGLLFVNLTACTIMYVVNAPNMSVIAKSCAYPLRWYLTASNTVNAAPAMAVPITRDLIGFGFSTFSLPSSDDGESTEIAPKVWVGWGNGKRCELVRRKTKLPGAKPISGVVTPAVSVALYDPDSCCRLLDGATK
jgi:hypothetical protein